MRSFVGRRSELDMLERIWERPGLNTCAVRGRRQIGKTSLLDEFSKDKRCLKFQFTRDAPYENLDHISAVLSEFTGRRMPRFGSLTEAEGAIADACGDEKTLLVFDEFPNLASDYPQTESILQRMLDVDFRDREAMFVICGSSESSMRRMTEDAGRPLYGRFVSRPEIGSMPYRDCMELHPGMDPLEGLKVYMTVGGVPKYHRAMSGGTYEECIRMCFIDRENDLTDEGRSIVTNELSPGGAYTDIVSCISNGAVRQKDIAERLSIDKAECSRRVERLEGLGIVSRRHPMLSKPGRPSYLIEDPLVDFCFSVVRRRVGTLSGGAPSDVKYRRISDDLSTFLGRRFEHVCGEWMDRNLDVKERGTWIGMSDGESTDIDIVAKVYGENDVVLTYLAECKFRTGRATLSTLDALRRKAKDAGVEENARFILFSISGFEEELVEYAEDHGIVLVDSERLIAGLRCDSKHGPFRRRPCAIIYTVCLIHRSTAGRARRGRYPGKTFSTPRRPPAFPADRRIRA